MGVLLSKPNTEKEYDEGENAKIEYAACSMQVRLSVYSQLRQPYYNAAVVQCTLYVSVCVSEDPCHCHVYASPLRRVVVDFTTARDFCLKIFMKFSW